MLDDPNEKTLHYEGWLEKLSPAQVKGWQKRWVVLHETTMKYWKDKEDYLSEKTPSGCIHAHTVLSINPHPDNILEFHIKVLKSRVEIRKYAWRIWSVDNRRPTAQTPTSASATSRSGTATVASTSLSKKNSVSALSWNLRVTWLAFLDDWCEKYLNERILSRFHVRKPAKFVNEVMGIIDGTERDDDKDESESSSDSDSDLDPRSSQRLANLESYLDKRSPGFFALWQRRYFVLMEGEDMIVYYKSREEYIHGSEPVGSFQLTDLIHVESLGAMEMDLRTQTSPIEVSNHYLSSMRSLMTPSASAMTVDANGATNGHVPNTPSIKVRTYRLRALTTESRDQWVNQLNQRLQKRIAATSYGRGAITSLNRSANMSPTHARGDSDSVGDPTTLDSDVIINVDNGGVRETAQPPHRRAQSAANQSTN